MLFLSFQDSTSVPDCNVVLCLEISKQYIWYIYYMLFKRFNSPALYLNKGFPPPEIPSLSTRNQKDF